MCARAWRQGGHRRSAPINELFLPVSQFPLHLLGKTLKRHEKVKYFINDN